MTIKLKFQKSSLPLPGSFKEQEQKALLDPYFNALTRFDNFVKEMRSHEGVVVTDEQEKDALVFGHVSHPTKRTFISFETLVPYEKKETVWRTVNHVCDICSPCKNLVYVDFNEDMPETPCCECGERHFTRWGFDYSKLGDECFCNKCRGYSDVQIKVEEKVVKYRSQAFTLLSTTDQWVYIHSKDSEGNLQRHLKHCELQHKIQEPLGYKPSLVPSWHSAYDMGVLLDSKQSHRPDTPSDELVDFFRDFTTHLIQLTADTFTKESVLNSLIPDALKTDASLYKFWKSTVTEFVEVAFGFYIPWKVHGNFETHKSFQDFLEEGQKSFEEKKTLWLGVSDISDFNFFLVFDLSYWQNTINVIFDYWGVDRISPTHCETLSAGTKRSHT
jgi:hypothetical protein